MSVYQNKVRILKPYYLIAFKVRNAAYSEGAQTRTRLPKFCSTDTLSVAQCPLICEVAMLEIIVPTTQGNYKD